MIPAGDFEFVEIVAGDEDKEVRSVERERGLARSILSVRADCLLQTQGNSNH